VSCHWAEVSGYSFFVMWNCWGIFSVFLRHQFCPEIFYGVYWIYIVFSYSNYCNPLFFCLFCDGKCYHSVYIVSECRYFMLIWMDGGKLNGGITTCGFSIDIYDHVVVSMYGNVQIIYCLVFFLRYLKLKVLIYLIDFIQECLLICFALIYIIRLSSTYLS